jgi:hypothetical protein
VTGRGLSRSHRFRTVPYDLRWTGHRSVVPGVVAPSTCRTRSRPRPAALEALAEQGFGVLTEIDVPATLEAQRM